MNELAQQLHEAAITLENDAESHKAYTVLKNCSYSDARGLIQYHGRRQGLNKHVYSRESREQLRRYFDETYNLSETRYLSMNSLADIPTIEFWKDSVREGREVAKATDSKPTFVIGQLWDTSFESRDNVKRARHGKVWEQSELGIAADMFCAGYSLEQICVRLQRPALGVLNQLCELELLRRERPHPARWDHVYIVRSLNRPTTPKEITMNKTAIIEITTKTLVNGIDVKDLDDSAIYDLIARQEAEIKRLEAIENKPKKLVAEIEKRRAGIKALVDYLDSKVD